MRELGQIHQDLSSQDIPGFLFGYSGKCRIGGNSQSTWQNILAFFLGHVGPGTALPPFGDYFLPVIDTFKGCFEFVQGLLQRQTEMKYISDQIRRSYMHGVKMAHWLNGEWTS